MAKQKMPQQVYCKNCINNFEAVPRISFLGFRKFRCPKCQQNVVWPLSGGFLFVYWVLISGAIVFRFVSTGGPLQMMNLFDPFALGALTALVMNYFLKQRMNK